MASQSALPPAVQNSLFGTPVHKRASSLADNQSLPGHIEVKKQMARDLCEEFVGPMPMKQFFEDFLNVDLTGMPTIHWNYFDSLPRAEAPAKSGDDPMDGSLTAKNGKKVIETDLYDPMIKLVEGAGLLEGFNLVNTSSRADRESHALRKWRPDISTYEADDDPDDFNKKGKKPEDPNPNDFNRNQAPWEFKPPGSAQPFSDPPKDATKEERLAHEFLSGGEAGALTRGQMATVMTEICARQHRTHVYLIYIGDPEVRILRADRAGVIVTEAIDFRTQSELFGEFLYRFSKATPVQRGIDPSVRSASEKERASSRIALYPYFSKESIRPMVTINIPDPKLKGGVRQVVVSGSLADAHALTGRATRAYAAYDLTDNKIRFLKDTWRADVEGMEKESDIMAKLNDAGVEHVPKMTCGGDIVGDYSTTITQNYINARWRAGAVGDLAPRAHHRLLEDFVPRRIYDFKEPKELLQAVHHAFIAHRQAYELCRILHRDISDNNVMITDEGNGILTDWDLSIMLPEPVGDDESGEDEVGGRKPRQRYRTGTWYFMSAALLDDPWKRHTLQDDLESFFHLILFIALHYIPLTGLAKTIDSVILKLFEMSDWDDKYKAYTGGEGKFAMITRHGVIGRSLDFPDNPAFMEWINLTLDSLKEHHNFIEDNPTIALDDPIGGPKDLKLSNHAFLDSIFTAALAKDGWADNRFHHSQRKPAEPKKKHVVPPSPLNTRATTSGLKRTLEERDESPSKRSRSDATAATGGRSQQRPPLATIPTPQEPQSPVGPRRSARLAGKSS